MNPAIPPRTSGGVPWPLVRRLALYMAIFFLWYLGVSLAVTLGVALEVELVGLALALLMAGLVFDRYLLAAPRRRWVLLRVRALRGASLRWTLAAVPVVVLGAWSLGEVWVRLVPVPAENFDPFRLLTRTAEGRLALTVLAVGIAPVLEEFFFRGLVQSTLEQRLGPARAIVGSGALFALVHFLPWVFPLHLFLGMAFGFAVYATRSVWAGVVLHAANNAAAVAGLGLQTERSEVATVWQTGPTPGWWLALAALAMTALAAHRAGRGLLAAGRAPRLRPSTGGE